MGLSGSRAGKTERQEKEEWGREEKISGEYRAWARLGGTCPKPQHLGAKSRRLKASPVYSPCLKNKVGECPDVIL